MADILRRNGSLRDEVIFDGVGHMSTIEAAQRVNELLDDVVDEVSRTQVQAAHL